MNENPTLYEQTIMFAFYIKDCILEKVNKTSRSALSKYLADVGKVVLHDRTISVTAETVGKMLKDLSEGKPLKTKEEKLSDIAVIFGATKKTATDFWEGLKSEDAKAQREKYLQALERYRENAATLIQEARANPRTTRRKPKGVYGHYEGTSFEQQGDFTLMLFLEPGADKKQIVGQAKVHYLYPETDEYHDLDIKGEILYNKLLMLQYTNVDQTKEHTGNIRLTIEDNGNILYGQFSGHGYPSGDDVQGGVVLQRSSDLKSRKNPGLKKQKL